MDRRKFLALSGATAAGIVGLGATPASAVTSGMLVGYSDPGDNVASTDAVVKRAAEVVREYHAQGAPIPTTASAAKILPDLQAGRSVVYSIKVPDSSTATANACSALAADIAAKGYATKVWISLWHEPNDDMSAAEYIDRFQASGPGIRAHGVKVGPTWQMYPVWNRGLDYTTYWPGDTYCDFLGIDTYPGDRPTGFAADPLETIAPLTSFAKSHGKTFGIAEVGVKADAAKSDPTGAKAWLGQFQRLGSSCVFFTYFNNAGYVLSSNGSLLVPTYQALYDHFQ